MLLQLNLICMPGLQAVLHCWEHVVVRTYRLRNVCMASMQVLQQGVEDPHDSIAAVAAINAALDGGDPPGPRPPRKRQKVEDTPGEPQVPS